MHHNFEKAKKNIARNRANSFAKLLEFNEGIYSWLFGEAWIVVALKQCQGRLLDAWQDASNVTHYSTLFNRLVEH